MDQTEVDGLIQAVRGGRQLRVPFELTLWPDTQAERTVLSAAAHGAFELTTTFREFWAGHGWSLEQKQSEVRTEAQVRESLANCSRAECELLP